MHEIFPSIGGRINVAAAVDSTSRAELRGSQSNHRPERHRWSCRRWATLVALRGVEGAWVGPGRVGHARIPPHWEKRYTLLVVVVHFGVHYAVPFSLHAGKGSTTCT